MKITKTRTWGAAAALTLGIAGCEPAQEHDADDGLAAVSFRDGDGPWGPGKLNTNFMGVEGDVPLNAIPLQDDPNADLRLHAVWANKCVGTGGQVLHGTFYTSDLDGELGISLAPGGKLKPAIFKKYGNPGVTCTVAGKNWIGTVWGLIYQGENYHMMILDHGLDDTKRPAYVWGRYVAGQLFSSSAYVPSCLEDQDPSATIYKFHAYHFSNLDVDVDAGGNGTGEFMNKPNTMFIGCFSGMIGKSARWGYGMWEQDMAIHEMATRVGRADYCGTGRSFTEVGNPLQIEDVYGVSQFEDESFPVEAVWSSADGRAICLGTPRHISPPDDPGFTCKDEFGQVMFTLPECDEGHLADPNATFITRTAE